MDNAPPVEFGRLPVHYSLSDVATSGYHALMLGGGAAQDHAPDPAPAPAGRVGECWTNAREFQQSDPGRYAYTEGLVRRGPGEPWEMHGYVLDQQGGHVVETTRGYEHATEYRGMVLDTDLTAKWFAGHPDEAGNSVVWCTLAQTAEDTMPSIIALLAAGR